MTQLARYVHWNHGRAIISIVGFRDLFKWSEPPLEIRHVSHLDQVNAEILRQGVGTSSAVNLPAAYRSVQMLADMTASMPIISLDPKTGLQNEGDTPSILRTPDPNETRHQFLHKIMTSLLFRGNAYLYVPATDRNGNAIAFMVINPDDVTVTEDKLRTTVLYEWTAKNIRLIPGVNFVHIPINIYPGEVVGIGPIQAARRTLAGYENLERFARDYFADNANPTGVLVTPAPLDKPEATLLKEQWNESQRGKRDVAILSGGIEFKPLMFTPEDSQFIQTREFEVGDVARLFGIPGPLLGATTGDSLTYATTESVVRWLLVTTLRPTFLERIEQSLSTMLPRNVDAFFVADSLLRADTQARFTAYQIALEAGFMTPNEVRQRETLDPKIGGDELDRATQPGRPRPDDSVFGSERDRGTVGAVPRDDSPRPA